MEKYEQPQVIGMEKTAEGVYAAIDTADCDVRYRLRRLKL